MTEIRHGLKLLVFCMAVIICAPLMAQPQQQGKVVVLTPSLRPGSGPIPSTHMDMVSDALAEAFTFGGVYDAINHNLDEAGVLEVNKAVEIGLSYKADYVCQIAMSSDGESYAIRFDVIDVTTRQLYRSITKYVDIDGNSRQIRANILAACKEAIEGMRLARTKGPITDEVRDFGTLYEHHEGTKVRYEIFLNDNETFARVAFYNDTKYPQVIEWKLSTSRNVKNTSGTITVEKRSKVEFDLDPINQGAIIVPGRLTAKPKK
jgi:hypothetical protein